MREVTRYIVTRFERHVDKEQDRATAKISRQIGGEYANQQTAHEVAYALCRQEHEQAGTPPGDEHFQYPDWQAPERHVEADV